MAEYLISHVLPNDTSTLAQIDELLFEEGITRDKNLDYICVMYDEDYHVIATGSCFGHTLRCFAVSSKHQGEGLLNQILSHLIDIQFQRGNSHLFLCAKISTAKFFGDLGFYEIARVNDQLVFMENQKNGFAQYLQNLEAQKCEAKSDRGNAAVVMNANPFTLGHLYLVEQAASQCDTLHLFMVSEDSSLVPFSVRKKLIMDGTAHIQNIVYHESRDYMISNATFPSYFLKDETSVITSHAKLDIAIFIEIASALHIRARYVGEEPTSQVTGIYNQIMANELPKHGIECHIIPRKMINGQVISASTVRKAIHDKDLEKIRDLVPASTYTYFTSDEAKDIIDKIQNAHNVIHY